MGEWDREISVKVKGERGRRLVEEEREVDQTDFSQLQDQHENFILDKGSICKPKEEADQTDFAQLQLIKICSKFSAG